MINHQQNLPAFEKSISYKSNRIGIADRFEGDSLQRMVSLDVDLIDFYDKQIQQLDLYLEQHAKLDDPDTFFRLQSIPGVGRILAMTMLKRQGFVVAAVLSLWDEYAFSVASGPLLALGIDPERYSGFAAGLGVERFCMVRHGIDDIRRLFTSDLRFLEQF